MSSNRRDFLKSVSAGAAGLAVGTAAVSMPASSYGRVIGVVLAVLSMQFLSSGLNMLQVSNFARELIWGVLLIVVMVLNTHSLAYLRSSLSKAPK